MCRYSSRKHKGPENMIVIFTGTKYNQPHGKDTCQKISVFLFCCEILLYALTFPIATHTSSDYHVIL